MAARKTKLEREASLKRQKRSLHRADAFGVLKIDECRVCKASFVDAHPRYPTMCVDCGKLYARYLKTGTKDSLTAGKRLVSRCAPRVSFETEDLMSKIKKQLKEANNMQESKVCKQCGRRLSIDAFRKYKPRGAGIYETTTGHHTVCIECENFNQLVNNAYRKPADQRTQKQNELLEKAKEFYEELQRRGLEPKGRYAADILGTGKDSKADSTDSYFASVLGGLDNAKYVQEETTEEAPKTPTDRGQELLEMELVQEPDVYQALVDEWRESIAGPDGRVKAEYLDLFNAVAERFDDYEDNYSW